MKSLPPVMSSKVFRKLSNGNNKKRGIFSEYPIKILSQVTKKNPKKQAILLELKS